MWANSGRVKERVYCGLDREHTFQRFIDEVLSVCERYQRSWGTEQTYRRRLGLPELPSDLYPYDGERKMKGCQERLRAAFAALSPNCMINPDEQMRIWNGEGEG
jgi:hypothetical protein